MEPRIRVYRWIALFMLWALLILTPGQAGAQEQGRIVLSTPFPGVSAQPGETVSFPIEVRNQGLPNQMVDLAIISAPKDWKAVLKGGGFVIHQVFVETGKTQGFELRVNVPAEAEARDYRLVLQATGRGFRTTLPIQVRISTSGALSPALVAQYPVLRGPSDAEFRFRVDLTNNSANAQTYSLGAQAPPGWQVTFQPSYENKQVATVSLQPGSTQGLDVKVTPPAQVKAGEYPIKVGATASVGSASIELRVVITGTYKLSLTTPSGRLNAQAYAGQENAVSLLVKNTGSADLRDVTFSSSEPPNWAVTFKPDKIDVLPAGSSREVNAFIKPDSRAIAGDYVVSITASTQETSNTADFRVAVQTPTAWGWVGIGIVVLVVAGVSAMFRAYGRR